MRAFFFIPTAFLLVFVYPLVEWQFILLSCLLNCGERPHKYVRLSFLLFFLPHKLSFLLFKNFVHVQENGDSIVVMLRPAGHTNNEKLLRQ